ncbi:MAG: hypothetical protein JXX29_22405 [Deltaproteobacteria bacterium]|nr:hypothetical protein [Deltaproteobacteria bacterium]MBN2674449.1 hypothetical protein [Deltaproteobacteria bacterium]
MKTILYITFSKRNVHDYYLDASVIYRCFQPCEHWRRLGYRSYVVHYMDAVEKEIPADIVVFHRPRSCNQLTVLLERYSKNRCVADFDDSLFDASILDSHPAYLSEATSLLSLKKLTNEYFQAAKEFHTFFVSSDGIKETVERQFSCERVFVVRNGISTFWRNLGGLKTKQKDKRIVSYFSGTSNHTADLMAHMDSIDAAVAKWPDLEVHVYGQLKLNQPLPPNWRRREPVLFHLLPQLIHQSYLCIAPMMDTPFNRCKSAIKFLEAASFGKPLITQSMPEFQRLSNPGLLFVEKDWAPAVAQMMNIDRYTEASRSARALSEQHHVADKLAEVAKWI